MKRTFRYDPLSGQMIEVIWSDDPRLHSVVGEIEPFISPRDGTVIRSRAHMRDYMERHNLVHFDPTNKGESDRYAQSHGDRALREQLWERVDKMMRKRHG
jgi:hypothetical protein